MGYSSVRGTSSVNRWLILVVVRELRVGARQAGALLNLRRGFLSWPVDLNKDRGSWWEKYQGLSI